MNATANILQSRKSDMLCAAPGGRAAKMAEIAKAAMSLVRMARPEKDIDIAYARETPESVADFTEWQRELKRIYAGNEYFHIWDGRDGSLLYAVNVTSDSLLTAASELMQLIARKF
jgi:hypothetical protein